ncbi:MAG: hypothetical protein EKK49_18420 [Rhodocyclaceae bacterium]|nr:MAG: hypothetical protein EKK49_18420 [Rhodocyclaceae bacterium]
MAAVSRLARSCIPFFFAAASVALVGCASGGRTYLFEGETKSAWKEVEPALPAFPERANLIPLDLGSESTSLSFIDEKSLTLAEDGVVRFTLIVRAAGGAQNVSFEGVRCETAERKLYAIGRNDREWIRPRASDWQRISDNGFNRQHALLATDFFCPRGTIPPNRDEIVKSLRQAAGLR